MNCQQLIFASYPVHLRDYQKKSITDIYAAWASGAKNVLFQLATGGGKTVIFCDIIKNHAGYSMCIAHRAEILSQMSLTLCRAGIYHNIIAQKNTIREIVRQHVAETGVSVYHATASCTVASIDTLINKITLDFNKYTLVIQDEGHHVLRENKWGRIASKFSHANGLYPTATPVRADGRGLGRKSDGIMDVLVKGVEMRELINQGFLTDYRIIRPPSDIDLTSVTISSTGDFSAPKLRTAIHKSHIVGDVVSHYLKFAAGKLGITFAVDIKSATDIAMQFKKAGVPAEIITAKTSDKLRADVMRRFRKRELLQIVNVDLLGEGVDVPALEVVSFARPTESYALYAQQFGRALRPMPGKERALIIDHVSNTVRHGLPDSPRVWSLERREKRANANQTVFIKTCLNPECLSVYPRFKSSCPFCGSCFPPAERSTPEQVDGDLIELSDDALKVLRGEISRIDSAPRIPAGADNIVTRSIIKRHAERTEAQNTLRGNIAQWAGFLKFKKHSDSEIYKIFYLHTGVDVLTAQTLGRKEAEELTKKIETLIDKEKQQA